MKRNGMLLIATLGVSATLLSMTTTPVHADVVSSPVAKSLYADPNLPVGGVTAARVARAAIAGGVAGAVAGVVAGALSCGLAGAAVGAGVGAAAGGVGAGVGEAVAEATGGNIVTPDVTAMCN